MNNTDIQDALRYWMDATNRDINDELETRFIKAVDSIPDRRLTNKERIAKRKEQMNEVQDR